MGAAAVVVDIFQQLIHLLLQQQLKEELLVEAWHPISGPNQTFGLGGFSTTHFSFVHSPSSLTD